MIDFSLGFALATFKQHVADCVRFLGQGCEEVNLWMDELFKVYGPEHRKYRHHLEGIDEARELFGEIGGAAATIHILRDCRNVPHKHDYETQSVDQLGLVRHWPTSAYIRYSDRDFEVLVMNNLLGPTGTVLWAFIEDPVIEPFLSGISKLTMPEVQQLRQNMSKPCWQKKTCLLYPPSISRRLR